MSETLNPDAAGTPDFHSAPTSPSESRSSAADIPSVPKTHTPTKRPPTLMLAILIILIALIIGLVVGLFVPNLLNGTEQKAPTETPATVSTTTETTGTPSSTVPWRKALKDDGFDDTSGPAMSVTSGGQIVVAGNGSSPSQDQWPPQVLALYAPDGTLTWSKTFSTPNPGGSSDWVGVTFADVAIDPNGDIIVAGNTSTTGGDFPARHGDIDALIAKFTPTGDLIWQHAYGGPGGDFFDAVTVAADGNIIALGSTDSGSGDFGTAGQVGKFSSDLTAKVTPDGDLIWSSTYVPYNDDDFPRFSTVAATLDGGVSLGGHGCWQNGCSALVVKLDATGQVVWRFTADGNSPNASFNDLAVDPSGNIIAVGTDDNSGPDGVTFDRDALIAKIAPDGTPLWVQRFGGLDDDIFGSVALLPNNTIVAAGSVYQRMSDGWSKALVSTIDQSGNLVWSHTYEGPSDPAGTPYATFRDVATTAGGSIITTGWRGYLSTSWSPEHQQDIWNWNGSGTLDMLSPDGTRA